MANTQVRVRSPKGNVGVTDVVDAGELSAYSMGALSGFDATSAASWTLQIGGSSTVQDVAIGRNPAGESELFVGTSATTVPFIIGGAPGTPGQSRTDALVLYKDPNTTSVVNNGLDITDYAVVAGTPATTGTQVAPSMATIRSTIPTGTLKSVAVIGYVTIAYGASSVTTGNFYKNPALLGTQVVANATARALITPVEGMRVYQADDKATYIYNGTEWLAYDSEWQTYTPVIYTNGVAETLANGTSYGEYFRVGKKCNVKITHTLGTNTTWNGTGSQTVSLPADAPMLYDASIDISLPLGPCYVINSGVAGTIGSFESHSAGRLLFTYHQYGATPNANAAVTNTAPFTSSVGDVHIGTACYTIA